jgi:hydrogenase nickel incorporation protein HypA/HybF
VIDVPGQAWCLDCETAVAIGDRCDACPRCGGYQIQILQGEEMRIKDLEVA